MRDDVIIQVKNLSKTFKLYNSPKHRLLEAIHPLRKKYHHEYHALKDISFEIKKGESVGILGKNGAGKSTLLKILTGVMAPTSGEVEVKGRIAALLELGAGFNPELSGMENIFFQGAIMGISKEEIEVKVKEIVEFADIGEFINQPVKTYSSGMFARLAFSIAINVDPDILIVDETLAVGDFNFQFKCFQKIKSFKEAGKVIILVSHSNQEIIKNCSKAILINDGVINMSGHNVEQIVFQYELLIRNSIRIEKRQQKETVKENFQDQTSAMSNILRLLEIGPHSWDVEANKNLDEHRFGNHEAILRKIILTNVETSFEDSELFYSGQKVWLKILVQSKFDFSNVAMGVDLRNVEGNVFWADNNLLAGVNVVLKPGFTLVTYEFDLHLVPGSYFLFNGLADLSGPTRFELDQRWKNKLITIVSNRNMASGSVYAPLKARYEHIYE